MARFPACRSLPQNPHLGAKEKLAGATPTKGNNTPAVSSTPTPAIAPLVISALSSLAQYLQDDFQQIFRTILDFRLFALFLALAPIFQQYKNSCEKPLKTRFPDIYWSKTYLEYYNFFWQCEDHFAIAGAKSQNWILFAATFLKNTALFCWQQHQWKLKDKTDVPITWEKFKAFFPLSLGKSEAFVNTI